MMTRQEAIDAARSSAAEAMRAKGEVQPMIIAHIGHTLRAYPMADAMGRTDIVKDVAAQVVGAAMRKAGADAYVFMSEAWYAPTSSSDPLAGVMPSQRPDRIEVLIVSASDREGDTIATYRMVRNAHGRSHH
jgi:hypothetical protein